MLPASPLSPAPAGLSLASAVCSLSAEEVSPCSPGGWLWLEGGWLELDGGWLDGGWLDGDGGLELGGLVVGGWGGVLALGQPVSAAATRHTHNNSPQCMTDDLSL
jgi:hypothetical protein